jgi:hypothetical protein
VLSFPCLFLALRLIVEYPGLTSSYYVIQKSISIIMVPLQMIAADFQMYILMYLLAALGSI